MPVKRKRRNPRHEYRKLVICMDRMLEALETAGYSHQRKALRFVCELHGFSAAAEALK